MSEESIAEFFKQNPSKVVEMDRLRNENNELKLALVQSVALQSHYAKCLNMYDGGKRIVFKNAREWLERLRQMRSKKS